MIAAFDITQINIEIPALRDRFTQYLIHRRLVLGEIDIPQHRQNDFHQIQS